VETIFRGTMRRRLDQNNRADFGTNTDEPQRLQRFYRLADAGPADAQPFDEFLFRGQLLARLYLATLDEVKDMVDNLRRKRLTSYHARDQPTELEGSYYNWENKK